MYFAVVEELVAHVGVVVVAIDQRVNGGIP